MAEYIFEIVEANKTSEVLTRGGTGKRAKVTRGLLTPTPPQFLPPEKIDLSRLPVTGSELFGRDNDLQQLDEIWESQHVNVISLVAWGGVGKSTLVNKWLERLGADNYRGAQRIYGWSFYSQGTGERVTSADQFIAAALDWFGDPDPTKGSPWDKGERLAELVRRQKTLLILDGMEPLQSDLVFERGKIKDPGLTVLVEELARNNNGLCVITTREPVADQQEVSTGAMQKSLEQISPQAGRALLRVGGVQGTGTELEKAAADFGNHALAINLLAANLHDIPGHHISHSREIPDLDIPANKGKHPRRVMAAFEQRWGESPAVQVLRILVNGYAAKLLNAPQHAAPLFDFKAVGCVTWFLLLSLVISYYQRSISVDRQYRYIDQMEQRICTEMGGELITRESKSYYSKTGAYKLDETPLQPWFIRLVGPLYTYFFPLILVAFICYKLYRQDLPPKYHENHDFLLLPRHPLPAPRSYYKKIREKRAAQRFSQKPATR